MTPGHPNHEDDAPLDHLLTGLGSASPAPGFEERILRRLESYPAPQLTRSPWRIWLPALTGAFACALIAFVGLHGHTVARLSPPVLAPRSAGLQSPSSQSENIPSAAASARDLHSLTANLHKVPKFPTHPQATAASPVAEAGPARLASFPAPPLPLTEQERLMLQILHKGDPEEIAMLNPDFRESLLARDRAEYKDFFPPPPPPPAPEPVAPANDPKGVSK